MLFKKLLFLPVILCLAVGGFFLNERVGGYRIYFDIQPAEHRSLKYRVSIAKKERITIADIDDTKIVMFIPTEPQREHTQVKFAKHQWVFAKEIAALPGDFFIVDQRDFYIAKKISSAHQNVNKECIAAIKSSPTKIVGNSTRIDECLSGFSPAQHKAILYYDHLKAGQIVAGIVMDDHILVLGTNSASFDSRYITRFGAVSINNVYGYAHPLF